MYVPMKLILEDAHRNNYAVVAANAINFELIRGIINAAISENSPIIINIGPGQLAKHGDAEIFASIVKSFACRTHIPIAFNYDHGKDMVGITEVFRAGFSSIMIDASAYSLEENIARTKEVVRLCHPHNVTVEAELGQVGVAETGDGAKADLYTNPDEASYFVEQTGIDALAVAVGTAHGKYPAGLEPKLDFDRLTVLKERLQMPLVLHGGSSSGDDNIRKAVACGINKLNVWTDSAVACRDALSRALLENGEIDFIQLMGIMEDAVRENITHYIRLVGSSGKADNFYKAPADVFAAPEGGLHELKQSLRQGQLME